MPAAKIQKPEKDSFSGKEKKPKPAKPKKIAKTRKVSKKEENLAFELLLKPLISEKATAMGQFGKYVFKVHPRAGKYEIKSAVEGYYGVGVTKVNIIKIHPKKRIHGRTVGYKQGFKKAVVTLQEGDAIGAVSEV